MEFKEYVPRPTGASFGKVRFNQLQFRKAIAELQAEVKKLKAELKNKKVKKED